MTGRDSDSVDFVWCITFWSYRSQSALLGHITGHEDIGYLGKVRIRDTCKRNARILFNNVVVLPGKA